MRTCRPFPGLSVSLASLTLIALAPLTLAAKPTLLPDPVQIVSRQASNYGAASVADFNHDGRPDLAIPGVDSEFVQIMLGRGDGTFESIRVPHRWGAGVAIGDFNEDGNMDFASAKYDSGQTGFQVYLGAGDGTFGAEIEVPLVEPPFFVLVQQLTAADFDGDGHLDLAVYDAGAVNHVVLGNGDGTFQPPSVTVPSGYCRVGHFDADGVADMACKRSGEVCLLYGLGDGTFENDALRDCRADAAWGVVAVGDLDGNGLDDVVVSGNTLTSLLLHEGRAFEASGLVIALDRPKDLELADLDEDGDLDIIAAGFYTTDGSKVALLSGNGDGTFAAATILPTPHLPGQIEVADFDMDGDLDLGVVSTANYTLRVIPGRGDGTFPSPKRRDYEGGRVVATGDFDSDGLADLAIATADSLNVRSGDGLGGFDSFLPTTLSQVASSILAADYDADGNLDVVLGNSGGANAMMLLGRGDGTFEAEFSIPLPVEPGVMASADFDHDGTLDLAVAGEYPDETVQILFGQGDGTMASGPALAVGVNGDWYNSRRIATDDLDADGNADLVATNPGADDLSVYLGNGAGGFGAASRVVAGLQPNSIAVEDFDRDGRLDLAVAVSDGGEFDSAVVLRGQYDGGFAEPQRITTRTYVGRIGTGDFDGDGQSDLILQYTSWYGTYTSGLRLGNGDATFEDGGTFPLSGSSSQIVDLNSDGRLDLAVAGNRTHVVLNQGPLQFGFESDNVTLGWPWVDGSAGYDVYRGGLTDLSDSNGDGAADEGYGICLTPLDPDPTDNSYVDLEIPASGAGFFYLRAPAPGGALQDLGESSSGVARIPFEACP